MKQTKEVPTSVAGFLLQKLIVSQLMKKFPTVDEIHMFITVVTGESSPHLRTMLLQDQF
jgi:hypothetical protein